MIINLPTQFEGIPLQVIETSTSLIINCYPYDKQSLVQLSDVEIKATHGNLEMPNLTQFFPVRYDNFNASYVFINSPGSSPTSSEQAQFFYHRIYGFNNGGNVNDTALYVADENNPNFEYAICGKYFIIRNIATNKSEVKQSNFNSRVGAYLCQNDTHVYFIMVDDTSRVPRVIGFNKTTGVQSVYYTFTSSYSWSTLYCLKADLDNKEWTIGVKHYPNAWVFGKLRYNDSNKGWTWTGFPAAPSQFNTSDYYYGYIPSSAIALEDGTEFCYLYHYKTNTFYTYKVDSTSLSQLGTKTLASMNQVTEFIKNKYKFGDDDTINLNTYFYNGNESSSSYASDVANAGYITSSINYTECMLAGKNNQFLIVCKGPNNGFTNTQALMNNQYIAVYLRKNPKADPLDLELKWFSRMSELPGRLAEDRTSNLKKVNSNKFILVGNWGYANVTLDDTTGELDFEYYRNQNVASLGYDSYGRIYHAFVDSTDIEVLTENTSSVVEISYEDENDRLFAYSNVPVYKNIIVKTMNIFGKQKSATFELYMVGNGSFADTGTKQYKGKTGDDGTIKVRIIINSGGRVKISASTSSQGGISFV